MNNKYKTQYYASDLTENNQIGETVKTDKLLNIEKILKSKDTQNKQFIKYHRLIHRSSINGASKMLNKMLEFLLLEQYNTKRYSVDKIKFNNNGIAVLEVSFK